MRIHELAALVILLASVSPVHANGGGYFRGGVENTGDVTGFEPKATENIRILDEKLTIRLGQKKADVEVCYLMRNETAGKVKVRFGFPVEELFDNSSIEGSWTDPEQSDRGNGKLRYCRNYKITAGGKAVSVKWQGEEMETEDKRFRGIAGWLVSELTFSANEEKPVMIRFQSGYPAEEWSVSDDTFSGAAIFKYRLSTAACWAGTIGSGRITLIPAGISPADLKVIKPVNRFKKDGPNWVWNFENLEPTLADDFEIEAVPKERSYMRSAAGSEYQSYVTYIERGTQWTMAHSNYQVKASSTLPPEGDHKYDAKNIRSFWGEEMWSEGANGPGTGEWLELEPEVAKPLTAISILPGCSKSSELFQANARPKKVRVDLNGEHQFTVDVPDSGNVCELPVSDYSKPVSKVRMTFLEVWPGSLYEDLCVTGVRLHVRLDKKPKIQQAR